MPRLRGGNEGVGGDGLTARRTVRWGRMCYGKCGTLRLKREIDVTGWFETGKRGTGIAEGLGRRGGDDGGGGGGLSRITSEEDLASSLASYMFNARVFYALPFAEVTRQGASPRLASLSPQSFPIRTQIAARAARERERGRAVVGKRDFYSRTRVCKTGAQTLFLLLRVCCSSPRSRIYDAVAWQRLPACIVLHSAVIPIILLSQRRFRIT